MPEDLSKESKQSRIDVISLILAIICLLFFGLLGSVVSLILLITYLISTKNNYFIQKIVFFFGFVGIILATIGFLFINGMENHGIDAIGEAIIYAGMINMGRITAVICSLLLLIIDNLHSKKRG